MAFSLRLRQQEATIVLLSLVLAQVPRWVSVLALHLFLGYSFPLKDHLLAQRLRLVLVV